MTPARPGNILQWALWSRARALALAAGILILAGTVIALAAPGGQAAAPRAAPTASRPLPAASPASPPPAPPSPAGTAPPAPAAAVKAGEEFAAAWADHAPGWLARASRYATPALAAQLAVIRPGMLPATRVTGPAAVTATAPGTVDLTVPTDAGPAAVTVRHAGRAWRADSVMLTGTGN